MIHLNKPNLKDQTTKGFTLIEVLAVIILIGILFSIVAPSWLAFMNRQRANGARDQVLQALRLAQSEAQRTRRPHQVVFNPGDATTVPGVAVVSGAAACSVAGVTFEPLGSGGNTQGSGGFQPGMVGLASDQDCIVFDEKGRVQGAEADLPYVVTLTAPAGADRGERCAIVQTLLGAIRVASEGEPNCGG